MSKQMIAEALDMVDILEARDLEIEEFHAMQLRLAQIIRSLVADLAAAEKELRQIGGLRWINERRQERGQKSLGIPCACEFGEENTQISWCVPHSEMRDALAAAQAEIEELVAAALQTARDRIAELELQTKNQRGESRPD